MTVLSVGSNTFRQFHTKSSILSLHCRPSRLPISLAERASKTKQLKTLRKLLLKKPEQKTLENVKNKSTVKKSGVNSTVERTTASPSNPTVRLGSHTACDDREVY